jgi:hypothetical protein
MLAPAPSAAEVETAPPPGKRNRAALVSFLLALSPFYAIVLLLVFLIVVLIVAGPDYGYTEWGYAVALVELGLLLASLAASIGAIVAGALALDRAKWYPPHYKGRGLAVAGLVLGIVFVCLIVFSLL